MFDLYSLFVFLAVQLSEQPNSAGTPTGAEAAAGASSIWMYLPMFLALMFLLMMLTSKPQQKEQQRQKLLLDTLKKNDKVVTAGGIVGTVVNFNSDSELVTLRIDESNNTKIQVLKQSVVRILKDANATSEEAKKS